MAWEDDEDDELKSTTEDESPAKAEPPKSPPKTLVRQGKGKQTKKKSWEAQDLEDIQKNWKPPYADKGGVYKETKRRMSYKSI